MAQKYVIACNMDFSLDQIIAVFVEGGRENKRNKINKAQEISVSLLRDLHSLNYHARPQQRLTRADL